MTLDVLSNSPLILFHEQLKGNLEGESSHSSEVTCFFLNYVYYTRQLEQLFGS